MTVEEMEEKLSVRVRAVENDGDALFSAILGIGEGTSEEEMGKVE